MKQPENEHGTRAGFNTGVLDLLGLLFEIQAVLFRVEPEIFAAFLDEKIDSVGQGGEASVVKAARVLPMETMRDRLAKTNLAELRSIYGVKGE